MDHHCSAGILLFASQIFQNSEHDDNVASVEIKIPKVKIPKVNTLLAADSSTGHFHSWCKT